MKEGTILSDSTSTGTDKYYLTQDVLINYFYDERKDEIIVYQPKQFNTDLAVVDPDNLIDRCSFESRFSIYSYKQDRIRLTEIVDLLKGSPFIIAYERYSDNYKKLNILYLHHDPTKLQVESDGIQASYEIFVDSYLCVQLRRDSGKKDSDIFQHLRLFIRNYYEYNKSLQYEDDRRYEL